MSWRVILSRVDGEGSPSRLRRGSLAALGMTLALGCASAAPQSKTAPLNEPEIHISQLSSVSEAARHMAGGLSVQYRIEIGNRANVPITVKRIEVISLGAGAYTLRPTSYPFDAHLNAGEATAVQFWVPANIDDPTIIGANGPVSIRLTMQYETPAGLTQAIVVQQVHALSGLD
jgi:hypothetical protein